jgi:hypothetical protein
MVLLRPRYTSGLKAGGGLDGKWRGMRGTKFQSPVNAFSSPWTGVTVAPLKLRDITKQIQKGEGTPVRCLPERYTQKQAGLKK